MSEKIEYTPKLIAEKKAALKLQINEVENQLAINVEYGKKELEDELIKKLLMPVSAAKLADLGFSLVANIVTNKVEDMLTTDEDDSAFKQGMSPIIKALLPEILEAVLLKIKSCNLSHQAEEDIED